LLPEYEPAPFAKRILETPVLGRRAALYKDTVSGMTDKIAGVALLLRERKKNDGIAKRSDKQ